MNEQNDKDLREALRRREARRQKPRPSADFCDSVMQRIGQQDQQPKHRRQWLYPAIGIAASLVMLLTLHHLNTREMTQIEQPVVQHQVERDSTVKAIEIETQPVIAQEKPVTDKAKTVLHRPVATTAAHKVSTAIPATDSLDYYIDKIERELAQVDESLYIERMNKIIRADERLQRMVNSYIMHTLDKEGRPQTADNMYNVKTEEDEE